jgi:BirA family biotin operon repressor/biotin-[acetyl-CoA-carboxylase] ligase
MSVRWIAITRQQYGPGARHACTAKPPSVSRFHISHVRATGSTNEDIARILGDAHARGLVLVADYQERGSGRKGRSWIAPPGTALLTTIALPDAIPSDDLWAVPFWTAMIVARAIREFGADPVVQWPNDLLIDGRKVAGILCVTRVVGEYAWVGCGIGVNVRRPQDEAIQDISPPPAFLSDVANVPRDDLLAAIVRHADEAYDELASPQRVAHAWELAANIPGARYRIQLDGEGEPFEATAVHLLNGGSLLVDRSGTQVEVALADARVLR